MADCWKLCINLSNIIKLLWFSNWNILHLSSQAYCFSSYLPWIKITVSMIWAEIVPLQILKYWYIFLYLQHVSLFNESNYKIVWPLPLSDYAGMILFHPYPVTKIFTFQSGLLLTHFCTLLMITLMYVNANHWINRSHWMGHVKYTIYIEAN